MSTKKTKKKNIKFRWLLKMAYSFSRWLSNKDSKACQGLSPHLNNVSFILATSALEGILLKVSNGNESTFFTYMDSISITLVEQPFFQEERSPMCNHAISLHLAKTQTAISGPPLCGLPGEDLHRPAPSRVDLIIHHVLQPLVVRGAKENHGSQFPTSVTIVHGLEPSHLVSTLVKSFANVVHLKRLQYTFMFQIPRVTTNIALHLSSYFVFKLLPKIIALERTYQRHQTTK